MIWELQNLCFLITYAPQEWHGDNEESTEKKSTQDSQLNTFLEEDLLEYN